MITKEQVEKFLEDFSLKVKIFGIVAMLSRNKYGSRFFETLSRDLKAAIPDAKVL